MEYGTMTKIGTAQATEDALFFDGTEWSPKGETEKYVSHTHTRSVADGDSSINFTGFGFKPSAIMSIGKTNNTAVQTVGFLDSVGRGGDVFQNDASVCVGGIGTAASSQLGSARRTLNNGITWDLVSFDVDGFTISFAVVGSPPAFNVGIAYIVFR
jgi:hypothetical protein